MLPALRRLQIELVALAAGKRALLVTLVARRAVALPVVVEVRVRVNVRGLLREFLVRLVAREGWQKNCISICSNSRIRNTN